MCVTYEIISTKNEYKGLERVLSFNDLPINKKNFDDLFQVYHDYEWCVLEEFGTMFTIENVREIANSCVRFHEFGVPCELVVYDNKPILNIDEYEIEFWGIDFEADGVEGILESDYKTVRHLLNNNCLCKTEEDVKTVLDFLNISYEELELFYLYKVIL